jgi:hypothetical protein
MRMGRGIGSYNKSSPKHGAPLRRIVRVVLPAEGMFDRNLVELECGHQTRSNGMHRARCQHCKPNDEDRLL